MDVSLQGRGFARSLHVLQMVREHIKRFYFVAMQNLCMYHFSIHRNATIRQRHTDSGDVNILHIESNLPRCK